MVYISDFMNSAVWRANAFEEAKRGANFGRDLFCDNIFAIGHKFVSSNKEWCAGHASASRLTHAPVLEMGSAKRETPTKRIKLHAIVHNAKCKQLRDHLAHQPHILFVVQFVQAACSEQGSGAA